MTAVLCVFGYLLVGATVVGAMQASDPCVEGGAAFFAAVFWPFFVFGYVLTVVIGSAVKLGKAIGKVLP